MNDQSFKTSRIFLTGAVVGAILLVVIFQGFNQKIQVAQKNPPTEQNNLPQPTTQPTEQPLTISGKIDQLGRELYQEGVTVSTKVDKVFPGQGFIMEDFTGTKLFVRWSGDSPKKGVVVSVKGPLVRLTTEKLTELSQEKTFSKELLNFLDGQKIIIEAKAINSAN